ncbi:MAG: hypothetical protein KAJ19_00295 [Gammaproteobacteria bacterium]|nr:hypothetical protein [Gammaproteobacteria bacterium]
MLCPYYEYECQACEHRMEVREMSDARLTECPACGASAGAIPPCAGGCPVAD